MTTNIFSALSSAKLGLLAQQLAIEVTGQNIANVQTEGYSRQDVSMAQNSPSQKGTIYLGTGARVTGIARAYDEFVENSLRDSGSEYATQAPIIEYTNRIVDLIGSESSGLSSVLDKFFTSAHELSADAASTTLRTIFLSQVFVISVCLSKENLLQVQLEIRQQ